MFCVQTKNQLGVVVVIISVSFGLLRICISLNRCTHNLPRTCFFEHIWMCKHQCQEWKSYIFENGGEPLILHLQRLVDSGLHMKSGAAQSGTQTCFFTSLSEDFMEKRIPEYEICFITRFLFFTMRTTDNSELTEKEFGPLNVFVKNQHKDSFFKAYSSVYSIPLAPLD